MSTTVLQALALARYLPPSLHGSAGLSHLSNEQRAEMHEWAESQPQQTGLAVNLMDWPGWNGVQAKSAEQTAVTKPSELNEAALA